MTPNSVDERLHLQVTLQYGAWVTSKKLPCLHKAYTTPITDHRRIGHANTHRRSIMTSGLHARGQGYYGCDTPANRSSRSRHDDAELSSRGKQSNRVVHGPVMCRENALTFHWPETLQFEGSSPLSLSSIRAPPRVSCSLGTLSKQKYIRSSAKRF